MDNLNVRLLSVENEGFLTGIFTSLVVSIVLKTCVWKFIEIAPAERWDLISMYRCALVSGFVNISVYSVNILGNNF